ncbi:MAG: hypothetical protein IV112_19530 [Methyloversatilis discipulorum]|uniref:PhaM family polyhydroxyalkanoate granule multifunctional regulatory protein n=1 Tax=Methyloversatilis TaxID=378210 RepID=UPI00199C29D1|nr:PhaM family polyhydroxyalkanoate granule multifunctional regulatory protein [Methyloversatilis discipulorum]MBC7139399.1 hypothetical protein [Defluviimonas sp.]MBT9518879.1 hypothetical protein [Methyloversatilis discipulorum]
MASDSSQYDPMEFLRSVWGQMPFPVPGFVTPTLDVGELDKRITDLKAVEGWLRMNLSMLQTSIQGLEVQRATLATMQAMAASATGAAATGAAHAQDPAQNPMQAFGNAAMWPWTLMQNAGAAHPSSTAPGDDTPPPSGGG